MQELPHTLPEVPQDGTADRVELTTTTPTDLAVPGPPGPGDLQHLADQSVEVLGLYGQITTLVQHHLTQLTQTAEQLRLELASETAEVGRLQAERTDLAHELETLRHERDSLREELETMVQTGLSRRRELAAEIEQLERARQTAPPGDPARRRRWWQFW